MIMEIIKFEVISAKYYSIECDEVTSHKRAYTSVIVRYVYDYCICERCIKLHRVSNLTGKSLADVIIAILANMNFPICNLVGKGFDRASSMSRKDEGVQQHLTVAPWHRQGDETGGDTTSVESARFLGGFGA